MPRERPQQRFDDLVRHAIDAFVTAGSFRRTQMADVAERMGISKGTLYLYVESKEALFQLALAHADRAAVVEEPDDLPVPARSSKGLIDALRRPIEVENRFPLLAEAVHDSPAADVHDGLGVVLGELYDQLAAHGERTKLVECFVADHPDLARHWFAGVRGGLMRLWTAYLESRVGDGLLAPQTDTRIAARLILETCMTWAVHIRWDPSPEPFDRERARSTVLGVLAQGLLPRSPGGQVGG